MVLRLIIQSGGNENLTYLYFARLLWDSLEWAKGFSGVCREIIFLCIRLKCFIVQLAVPSMSSIVEKAQCLMRQSIAVIIHVAAASSANKVHRVSSSKRTVELSCLARKINCASRSTPTFIDSGHWPMVAIKKRYSMKIKTGYLENLSICFPQLSMSKQIIQESLQKTLFEIKFYTKLSIFFYFGYKYSAIMSVCEFRIKIVCFLILV